MQIFDLCVGKPYTEKGTGFEKKRWVKVGVMFVKEDEQSGELRYSLKFDAYPAGDVFISAFPKKQNEGQAGQPAPKEAASSNSAAPEEIRLEDVPF